MTDLAPARVEDRTGGMLRALGAAAAARPALTLLGLGTVSLLTELAVFTLRYPLLKYYSVPLLNLGSLRVSAHSQRYVLLGWIVLFACYYGAYRLCPRDAGGRLAALVAGVGAALALAFAFMYPVASSDLYDYIVRGHLVAQYHVNPFTTLPSSFPHDPFYRYIYWKNVPADYAALWHLQVDAVSYLVGTHLLASLLAYKAIVLTYWAGGMGLLYGTLRRLNPAHAARGLLLYAWNPLALFEFAGNGHNDAVIVFWMLLAVFLLVRGHGSLSLLALAAGILVKFVPVLVLPLFVVAVLRLTPRWPDRFRALGLAAAGAAVLTVLVYLPYGLHSAVDTVTRLLYRDNYVGDSLPALFVYLLTDSLHVARPVALAVVGDPGKLAVLALLAYECRRLSRITLANRAQVVTAVVAASFEVVFLFVLVGVTWLFPWYLLWTLAFAPALAGRGYALRFTALSVGGVAMYFLIYFVGAYLAITEHVSRLWRTLLLAVVCFGPAIILSLHLRWPRLPLLRGLARWEPAPPPSAA